MIIAPKKITSLLSIRQFSNEQLMDLIHQAIRYKNKEDQLLNRPDLSVANLFFENSTRTKKSFEIAERKFNLQVIDFSTESSSVQKGETLFDTCKTLEMLGVNLMVIRHPVNNYYDQLDQLNIPIINGGDGSGEHPSQCLLDLMTIYQEFNQFKDLNIAICGDIKNSRVARSNYDALTRLGAKVTFVSPDQWQDPDLKPYSSLDQIIDQVDVLMLLRVQSERHLPGEQCYSNEEYNKLYGLNKKRYDKLKDNAIIMHPAPINRGVEITDELVMASKSRIFQQMENGVYTRQAIINYIIQANNI